MSRPAPSTPFSAPGRRSLGSSPRKISTPLELHRNAQSLLQPLKVVNPFADQLTFLDDKTRSRRDHMKYLTLIRAIALLHQHQRRVHTVEHRGKPVRYVEVEPGDITSPIGSPMRCWAERWTSCHPRPGGCSPP